MVEIEYVEFVILRELLFIFVRFYNLIIWLRIEILKIIK